MVKKTYNPRHVRPKQIKRFRGLVNSEPGMVIADPFVGESENGVSRKIRQLERRSGMTKESDRYNAGINHALSKPLYFALGEGTRVHVEGRYPGHDQTPIDDISIPAFPPYADIPWEDDWNDPVIPVLHIDDGEHFKHKIPQTCLNQTVTIEQTVVPDPSWPISVAAANRDQNYPRYPASPSKIGGGVDLRAILDRLGPGAEAKDVTEAYNEAAENLFWRTLWGNEAHRRSIIRDNRRAEEAVKEAIRADYTRSKNREWNADTNSWDYYWYPKDGTKPICWQRERVQVEEDIPI